MKAIAYRQSLPIDHADALLDIELPVPQATGRDLLVAVRAISVNPVDTKIRRNVAPAEGQAKVIGWGAAGVVQAVGPDVTLFKPGDEVWYAGRIPADHLGLALGRRHVAADLGVDRIDRNGAHFDQQVAAGGLWRWQFDVDQRFSVFDRERFAVGDCFHGILR